MRGSERSLWNRAVRRLKSPRASAYLEYAVVMPLVVMMISALIEFAAFWDAKIMANHTAWTCARIASVEAGQTDSPTDSELKENRLKTDGMKRATALLMSTCAMGSMHGSASDFVKTWYDELVTKPLTELKNSIAEKLKTNPTKSLDGKGSILDKMSAVTKGGVLQELMADAGAMIVSGILDPIFEAIASSVEGLFKPLLKKLEGALNGNRVLRQFAYATSRVAEDERNGTYGGIITVTERKDMAFARGSTDTRLDFPRCLDGRAKCDDWFVISDSPWPPNGQAQRMIDVTIKWPFESAWLFPALSSSGAKSNEGRPTAVGRALFYPQPTLRNEHLKSEGAEAFAPGETNDVSAVTKVKNKYVGFMKVAALYYHYLLGNEEVGPYDSKSSTFFSYKGIGVGISGAAEKGKIYRNDGLVFWMDRAPDDTSSHKAWGRKASPDDYNQCFRNISGEKDETCKFWPGIAFNTLGIKTSALKRFESHSYWRKEWFCWGNGRTSHLRMNHSPNLNSSLLSSTTIGASGKDARAVAASKELRQAFLVALPLGREVTKREYEAGAGVKAPYDTYVRMRDKDARFSSSVTAMVAAQYTELNSSKRDECGRLDREAERILFTDVPALHASTRALVAACSKELDKAVNGDAADSVGGDDDSFVDVGGGDEEIMKDPSKAAEILEKKLKDLRGKVFDAIKNVNECERNIRSFSDRNAAAGFEKRLKALTAKRGRDVVEFAQFVGMSIAESGGAEDPDAVWRELHMSHYLWGEQEGTITESVAFWQLALEAKRLFQSYHDAQVELAKLFNLKAATAVKSRATDPDPSLDGPGADSALAPISSDSSGSDDDKSGDSWSRGAGGWTSDGKGADR